MFLRRNRKKHKGEDYDYWTLVKSVRTARGPRQRAVATLGKLPGLDLESRVGWEHIADILDGKTKPADFLSMPEALPAWATVNTRGMRVERLRRFGDVYLALALWRRLKLDAFFNETMAAGREEIAWGTIACLLVLARFCAPSSELQIADFWYGKTALEDLLGVCPRTGYSGISNRSTASCSAPRMTCCFTTSPRPTSKAKATIIPRPGAVIRATRAPIACRFASRWW